MKPNFDDFERWITKVAAVILAVFSFYGVGKDLFNRSPVAAGTIGFFNFSAVLILGVVAAIAYGLFWTGFEKFFGWDFGSGGNARLPRGWSAVALSLSLTLPLGLVPLAYQKATGLLLIPNLRAHGKGAVVVVIAGILTHLLMYGTGSAFRGLRRKLMPPDKRNVRWRRAIIMEFIFATVYFMSFVLPYRAIVEGSRMSLQGTFLHRTIFPALAFFSGMAIYISVKPESLRERRYIEIRGFLSALLMMGCLCAGMFG